MTEIDLSYGDLDTKTLASVVTDHASVVSLDLSGNQIPAEALIEIVDTHICRMVNLETLDLKANKIGPRGAEHLCKALIQHCPKLRYLDLNENGILNEALFHLAYLLQGNRIESLLLVSNHLTPRGIPTLCDGLLLNRHIRELVLAFNVLGDTGASTIAKALADHPSLQLLDISDNRISDLGAVDIAEHLILSPLSHLDSLNLSVNSIGDVGFTAIAEAVARTRNRRLRHLDLGCNAEVGPMGRRALIAHVASMRHLKSLGLCSCNLSDEDALSLTVAVLCDGCGITSIEGFNNPEMLPKTERALDEALKLKRIKRLSDKKRECQYSLVASIVLGAAVVVGIRVALRHWWR
ncbi:putative leucine-rich repeat protein [Trypanosoma grayi]|uniref:putative leucine-rich repeat protein n=1 Tax=Trypanosoma grayi TaxID=71804 RepID=UPI0004F44037|nr:putative leucine-rich repeat protein [Trypanosoma grayi]KEG10326.1 putative leucine-rich repeat protein [Trypanosoma grayi]